MAWPLIKAINPLYQLSNEAEPGRFRDHLQGETSVLTSRTEFSCPGLKTCCFKWWQPAVKHYILPTWRKASWSKLCWRSDPTAEVGHYSVTAEKTFPRCSTFCDIEVTSQNPQTPQCKLECLSKTFFLINFKNFPPFLDKFQTIYNHYYTFCFFVYFR